MYQGAQIIIYVETLKHFFEGTIRCVLCNPQTTVVSYPRHICLYIEKLEILGHFQYINIQLVSDA